jgi:methionyl-tRNA formyltransferase
MKITILSDLGGWFESYIPDFIKEINNQGLYEIKYINSHHDLKNGDIAFFLSYYKIVNSFYLKKHKHNIVVHASNLPRGKGWSPLTYQILEGLNKIPISLLEAEEQVDSGNIYLQSFLKLNGTELISEIRAKLVRKTFDLCSEFLIKYPKIIKDGKVQKNKEESFFQKRTPQDSKLDINKTIKEQFNLLRVCDSNNYPAFFEFQSHKYIITIVEEI